MRSDIIKRMAAACEADAQDGMTPCMFWEEARYFNHTRLELRLEGVLFCSVRIGDISGEISLVRPRCKNERECTWNMRFTCKEAAQLFVEAILRQETMKLHEAAYSGHRARRSSQQEVFHA